MSKKIIGLLLVVCLCIGLLPVVALAEEAAPAKATLSILSWIKISAEEGGAIGYLKNQEYDAFTPVVEDGEIVSATTGEKGWTQVPGSADDWNIKYEWPKGGTPVLTLKNAKMDMMSDTGVPFCNQKTDPDTNETYYTDMGSVSAIFTDKGMVNRIDLKIVVQGDNYIDVSNGIVRGEIAQTQYLKNITIVGEDGAKLYASGHGIGISARPTYSVTLENLNLEMPNTTVGGGIAIPIRTKKADVIIKNCTITTGNEKNTAIYAEESGNILIENSTLNVYSKLSSTSGVAAILADGGTVTINSSKVNAEGANNSCINGTSVTVNNSDLDLKSGYYSIYAGGKDGSLGDITINGGSVLSVITADNGGAFWKCPILSANMEGLAGPSEEGADFYDESKYKSMWLKLSSSGTVTPPATQPSTPAETTAPSTPAETTAPSAPAETTAPSAPAETTAPSAPAETTAPSTPAETTAPSAPAETTAPSAPAETTAPTQGADNPGTGDNGIVMFTALLLVAAFGIVATVAFSKKNSIVE